MQDLINKVKGEITVSFKQLMFLPSFINIIIIIYFALELIIENSFTSINLHSFSVLGIFFPLLIFIYLPPIIWWHFRKHIYIKYNEKGIILTRNKRIQSFSWDAVKEIKSLPFSLIIHFNDKSSFVFPFPKKSSVEEMKHTFQEYIIQTF